MVNGHRQNGAVGWDIVHSVFRCGLASEDEGGSEDAAMTEDGDTVET